MTDQHGGHEDNLRVLDRATLMIVVLAGLAVLLMAAAIAVIGVLTGRDDNRCASPFGYPGMHADGGAALWVRP